MREEAARAAAVKSNASNAASKNPHPEAEQLTISVGEQTDETAAVAETQSENAAQSGTEITPPPPVAGTVSPASSQDTPPAQDPFINPPKAKRFKASFVVIGSRDEILSVRQFMIDNNIHFEKGA